MNSIRKWIFRPKKSDGSLLAQFYYADEDLNAVAAELDSFDGRKEPERCTTLINKLRSCQDKLLCIVEKIMQEAIPEQRANRDFRVKFPDDVMQENLAGQLWFGAECLAAGSSIMNREVESASMRPLARTLTHHLDQMRGLLREHSLKLGEYSTQIKTGLALFDKLFAEFELSYVSAMVPVKTMREYDVLQQVMVLFSETVQRAVSRKLITTDMIDSYDPALMFTIPRLAIVCGLYVYPEGPLNPDMDPTNMSEMFRPFQTLLYKIRELLSTLAEEEMNSLEKALCSSEEPTMSPATSGNSLNSGGLEVGPPIVFQKSSPVQVTVQESESDPEYSSADALSTTSGSSDSSANDIDSIESEASGSGSSPRKPKASFPGPESESYSKQKGARPKHGTGKAGRKKKMTHQESKDSGMPSEPDVTYSQGFADNPDYFDKQEVASHRLRHSKSWPNAKRRRSNTKQVSGSELAELGASGGASLDLIDTPDVNNGTSDEEYNSNQLNFRARSSHEFTFSIPADTSVPQNDASSEDNTTAESTTIPQHEQPAKNDNENRIRNITDNIDSSDNSSAPTSPHHSSKVSFVTEALNDIFLTDPDEASEVTCNCCEPADNMIGSSSANQTQEHTKVLLNEQNQASTASGSDIITQTAQNKQFNRSESVNNDRLDTEKPSICDKDIPEQNNLNEQKPENIFNPAKSCDKCICSPKQNKHENISTPDQMNISKKDSSQCEKCAKCSKCSASRKPSAIQQPQTETVIGSHSHSDTSIVANNVGRPTPSIVQKEAGPTIGGPRYFRSHSCPCKPVRPVTRITARALPEEKTGSNTRPGSGETQKLNTSQTSRSTYDSDTSSSASEGGPEEENDEISLAIKAAEAAARQEARSRFKSSGELIHRLFVCISGVADQLQTNYAADLRHILKCVFECNASEPIEEECGSSDKSSIDTFVNISAPESPDGSFHDVIEENTTTTGAPPGERGENNNRTDASDFSVNADVLRAPSWVPDQDATDCYSCKAPFTFVRRRHHCRNCGNVFCGRCSSNNVPLPQFGHQKPVRVCNRCFMFHVTPFTVEENVS